MFAKRNGITLDFQRNYMANTETVKTVHTYSAYKPLTNVEYEVSRLKNKEKTQQG